MIIAKLLSAIAVVAVCASPQPVFAFGCPVEPSPIDCTGHGYVPYVQVPQQQYQQQYVPHPYGPYSYQTLPGNTYNQDTQMQHLLGGYMRQQYQGY